MEYASFSGLFGYGLVLCATAAALFQWRMIARPARPPIELKLLRAPGELSLRALRRLESRLPLLLLGAVLVPLGYGLALLFWAPQLAGLAKFSFIVIGWLSLFALLYYIGRYVHHLLEQRHELAFRFLGERAVAEELAPLLARGYRIFHDVAIHGLESHLDLDHVLVGPTGITAIECETHQRPPGDTNESREHEVTFDGKSLLWPWGADRATVACLEDECANFAKWIEQTTGYRLHADAVLAVPGWWLNVTGHGIVTVANHKQVLTAVTTREETVLTAEQIEKICHELELHCRDVED